MMKREGNARRRILNLLKKHGKMTSQEVGKALGMTTMGARQHLTNMENDGLVQAEFIRQKVGRPALYFLLSEEAEGYFPQHYDQFCLQLLRGIRECEGPECLKRVLKKRRESILPQYKSVCEKPTLHEKVEAFVHICNQQGKMMELEVENTVYRLVVYHCPIYILFHEFSEVIEEEANLIAEVLGHQVTSHLKEHNGLKLPEFTVYKHQAMDGVNKPTNRKKLKNSSK